MVNWIFPSQSGVQTAKTDQKIDRCLYLFIYLFCLFIYFHTTIKYIKGTICLRPQIAKANRGGRSYTQSVVKPIIIKLQQYNNIRLNTTMLN